MFVDSHAHLDDARFGEDRAVVIQRAWDAGVRRIVTIGTGKGPDDMGCGIPIAESYDWIHTSLGVHPHDAANLEDRHLDLMKSLAEHPRVVAIGETGLDYHYDHAPRDTQRAVFQRQLELASELDLPVIVHTRNADVDTEDLLRRFAPRRGVLHCFTSGAGLADAALEIGFMISFSGIATFPNAKDLIEIVRKVPSDRILIETDCPYLAPVPHRGKRNEPAYVADTARFIANVRGVPVEQLQEETLSNYVRLFSLEDH
jgi:TatD DNase family protein